MRAPAALLPALLLGAAGCSTSGEPSHPTSSPVGPVAADLQRGGDAAAGYDALVNEGYVGCGVPYSAYRQVFGPAPDALRLPGRRGHSAEMPYNFTAFTTHLEGVEVASPNCLQCHAETWNGQVVIGLGSHTADYTDDIGGYAILAGALVSDPVERQEWKRWSDRAVTISPYVQLDTRGVNPADDLAAVLFAHRDPDTLAWSQQPLIELPAVQVVPVDVPPWWNMKKKNAMFYLAAGRGDHARIMMTASTLCVESVDDARAIDAYFPDVEAYIASLTPPAWSFAVDPELAARGRELFEGTCARCHGTYGDGAADGTDGDTYPNLVVAVDEVGTDPTLATGTSQFAGPFVDWFNSSFYGEIAWLAPAPGYVAPPLDGVWATAPYLHNGSVPTLQALLDSKARPRYWTRSFGTSADDYDPVAVGWRFTALDTGKASPDDTSIYDTTERGYGAGGHPFGDAFTDDERAAVIEYLKTL